MQSKAAYVLVPVLVNIFACTDKLNDIQVPPDLVIWISNFEYM
jgi:hypothetical protein